MEIWNNKYMYTVTGPPALLAVKVFGGRLTTWGKF